MAETIPCNRCKGDGFVDSWPYRMRCESCNGRGWDGFKPDHAYNLVEAVFGILDETDGSEGFVNEVVKNAIKSWKANETRKRKEK